MDAKGKTTGGDARARRGPLRIHGAIARDLGILIVSGKYRPGERLNGEVAASDRLRVSRTAYRVSTAVGIPASAAE